MVSGTIGENQKPPLLPSATLEAALSQHSYTKIPNHRDQT